MKSRPLYWVIGILFFITIFLQSQLLKNRFSYAFNNPACSWCADNEVDEIQFIPAVTIFIRGFAPADPDFLSDLLWLRTCYYFGSHAVTDREYFYLSYLLHRITDLSPKWELPYLFGSIALYLEAENPDRAILLLDKGIFHLKESWELMFLKGFILWKAHQNYEAAAKTIFSASQLAGAPAFLSYLSATLAKRSENTIFKNYFYDIVLKSIVDPLQKQIIQGKLKEMVGIDTTGN